MDTTAITEVVAQGFRLLVLISLPLLAAIAIGGAIAGALQTITNIYEPAIGFLARLVAFVFALYLVWGDLALSLQNLLRGVLQ
jgi:type III secretory pathway component EscS